MAGETCIFCGRDEVVELQMPPKWATDALRDEWDLGPDGFKEPLDGLTGPDIPVDYLGGIALAVCAACRDSWYRELEDAAKPSLLGIMAIPEPVMLAPQELRPIASWAWVTALIRDTMPKADGEPLGSKVAVPRHWATEFYASRELPPNACVDIAAFLGAERTPQSGKVTVFPNAHDPIVVGVAFTVGFLACRVVFTEYGYHPAGSWLPVSAGIRLVPTAQDVPAAWPGENRLNNLDAFYYWAEPVVD